MYCPYQKTFWNVFSLRWCPLHHLLMCWCPTRLVLPLVFMSLLQLVTNIYFSLWNYLRLNIFLLLDFDEHPTCSPSSSYSTSLPPPFSLHMVQHPFCSYSSETLKFFTSCWIPLLLLTSHANCHVPLIFRTVSLGLAFSSLQSHNILHFFWIILTNCQQYSRFLPTPKLSGHSLPRTQ